jgi:colanic acid biosynthesis glycosyl transferase WcaI
MRVLVLGLNFAPELTGVGKYTGEMVQWLATRRHEVRVVTAPPYYPGWKIAPGYHSWKYGVESWNGARVWRCPVWVPRQPGGLKRLVHLASFAVSSSPIMGRQVFWRPDVVLSVEPTLFSATPAWLTARLSGARAWLHIQDFEVDAAFELNVLRGVPILRLVTMWEHWLLRRFDRVSTISQRMAERAAAKGIDQNRILLFPNWADETAFVRDRRPSALRAELGIADDQVVALYSGTMGKKQGLRILGLAAAALRDEATLMFVFCGDGPGRSELVAQCDGLENVRFLALQPHERLGALLGMADIHLLPQQAGAADLVMPSKLTGMLASGRPVVATASLGTQIADVASDCGLVVPPGDTRLFAEAIRTLTEDAALRTRLGANAHRYAQEHLSRDRALTEFENALKELVAKEKAN